MPKKLVFEKISSVLSQGAKVSFCAFGLTSAAWARVPDHELRRIESLERSRHFYHVEALEYGVRARRWGKEPWDEEKADWVVREYILEEPRSGKDELLAKIANSPLGLDKLRAASRHISLHHLMAGGGIDHWLMHADPSRAAEFEAHIAEKLAGKEFRHASEVEFLKPGPHEKMVQGWETSGNSDLIAAAHLARYFWNTNDLESREAVTSDACDGSLAWYMQNSSLEALLRFISPEARVDLFERLLEQNPGLALTQNQGLVDRFVKPEFVERAIRLSRQCSKTGSAALKWLRQLPDKSIEVKRFLVQAFPADNDLLLENREDLPELLPRLRQVASRPGPQQFAATLALAEMPGEPPPADLRSMLREETEYDSQQRLARAIWLAEGAREELAVDALVNEKSYGEFDSQRYQLAEGLLRYGVPLTLRPKLLKMAAENPDDEIARRLYRAAAHCKPDYRRWLGELCSGPIADGELQELELSIFSEPELLLLFANGGGRTAGVSAALLGKPELCARILDSQDDEAIVYLLNYSRILHRALSDDGLRNLANRDQRYRDMVLHFLETRDDPAGQRLTSELGAVPGATRESSAWLQPLVSEMEGSTAPDFLLAYRGRQHYRQGDGHQVVIRKAGEKWTLQSSEGATEARRELTSTESKELERWFSIHYSPTVGDVWRPMSHDFFEEVLICTKEGKRVLKGVNSDCGGSKGLFLRDLCRRMRKLGTPV